jgi:hypothetical protein
MHMELLIALRACCAPVALVSNIMFGQMCKCPSVVRYTCGLLFGLNGVVVDA